MAEKPNPSFTICVKILLIQAESWYTLRVEHFKILKSPSVKNRNYLQKIAVVKQIIVIVIPCKFFSLFISTLFSFFRRFAWK